jgi:hypothetical protein
MSSQITQLFDPQIQVMLSANLYLRNLREVARATI